MENVRMALTSLWSNKMRAVLTMLGIIIGIGSVIGIMTIGDSLTGYMNSSMQDFGVSNITVSLASKKTQAQGMAQPAAKDLLTDEILADLCAQYPADISAVSISEAVGSGKAKNGRKYANFSLSGVNEDFFTANSVTLTEGRMLSERDNTGFKKVVMVSDKFAANLYGQESAVGKQINLKVNNVTLAATIVGVYEYEVSALNFSMAPDADKVTKVYIPLSTALKVTGNKGYSNVTLITAGGVDATAFATQAQTFLNRYYARNENYETSAFSMESMVNTFTSMMSTVSIAIAAIAAISLLVGGIGVMNIMLVSITERTREIGTRMALGATESAIMVQFIVEAVIICLLGGVIGIITGVGLGYLGAALLGFPAAPSVFSMILAIGFSMAVGVFFGYYPAKKAAHMDPIEALRYE